MLITDAAVTAAGHTVADLLGPGWHVDPDAPTDGAAHLLHTDGRRCGFRPIFGGIIVQLWIIGNTAPPITEDADDATKAAHDTYVAGRLAAGSYYHTAVSLLTRTDDEDTASEDIEPEDLITGTFRADLLPAFEQKPFYVGHRPWLDVFAVAVADLTAAAELEPAGTALRECPVEAHTDPSWAERNFTGPNISDLDDPAADDVEADPVGEEPNAPRDETDTKNNEPTTRPQRRKRRATSKNHPHAKASQQ